MLKNTAASSIALKKMETRRAAREREAQELVEEIEADDDDNERERVWRRLEAWKKLEILRVETSECDFTKPVPLDSSGHVRWPIVCEVADTTDPTLLALQRHVDITKILRAGRNAIRTMRVPVTSVTHADLTEPYGISVVGFCIGCEDDGTPRKCIAFQKTLHLLSDLGGNYAGSTKLRDGFMGTLGMDNCYVIPMALVKAEDRCLGEGGLYGAQVYSTGFKLVGQCLMQGAPDAWAPSARDVVLADEDHPLHEYALRGVAPPLTAPLAREAMSGLVKEGLANMSDDARERQKKGAAKGRKKHGVGLAGEGNYAKQENTAQNARFGSYTCFLLVWEALECIQDKRPPAPWAAGCGLTPAVLKCVAKAGLADGYFVTDLPEEPKKGFQRFYIDGFEITKEEGDAGTDVRYFQIATQRGCFDAFNVAVSLGIFREDQKPPKTPWGGITRAPASIKALVARALAWSPDGADDPVTEQRPMKPFMYFGQLKRAEVRAEVDADEAFAECNGSERNAEASKRLGKLWAGLSKRAKQRYKDDAPLVECIISKSMKKRRAKEATQPSPPPAKKPRSAAKKSGKPRRSTRPAK